MTITEPSTEIAKWAPLTQSSTRFAAEATKQHMVEVLETKWSINFMHHLQLINKRRRMETLDGTGLAVACEYMDNGVG